MGLGALDCKDSWTSIGSVCHFDCLPHASTLHDPRSDSASHHTILKHWQNTGSENETDISKRRWIAAQRVTDSPSA